MSYFSLNKKIWFEKNDLDLTVMDELNTWFDLITIDNGTLGVDSIFYRSTENLASAGAARVELRLVDKQGIEIVRFANNSSSPVTSLSPGEVTLVEFDTSRYLGPGSRVQGRVLTALLTAGKLNMKFLCETNDSSPLMRTVGY